MLGKRPRALQRTESKSELMSDEASIELQGTEHMYEKPKPSTPVFGAPRQVIGFNPVNKDLDAGGSPRSVLEVKAFSSGTGAAIVQEKQVRSPRSPRSGLESLLSSPRPWDKKGSEGVGLAIVAALHAVEEEAVKIGTVELAKGWIPNAVPPQLPHHLSPRPGRPIPITQELQPSHRERKEPHQWRRLDYEHLGELSEASVWCCKGVRTQDNKKKPEHVSAHGAPADMEMDSRESIFSTASPASSFNENSGMLSAIDFLSSCFYCKRHLGPGKDIYIYRGDRAFCSVECRYQQIVNDEHKEKCPPLIATDDRKEVCSSVALKGASVLPSASSNQQSRGTTAAAA